MPGLALFRLLVLRDVSRDPVNDVLLLAAGSFETRSNISRTLPAGPFVRALRTATASSPSNSVTLISKEAARQNGYCISAESDRDYGGRWLFGRFCYWINGTQVGDCNIGTSLRDAFFSMKRIAGDRGNRQCTGLCDLPGEEAFHLLDGALRS